MKRFFLSLIAFITFISNRLKKGSKTIFTDLNKFIDEVLGFGEEVGDHALTKSEKNWKKKQKRIQEKISLKKRRCINNCVNART